jgi:hypothetical protein
MDQAASMLIARLAGAVIGFGVTGFVILALAALVFPSTRAALARRLSGQHRRDLDADDVLAQLTSTNAQLSALRGEVYALRCEVAGAQALRG